jgi:hypothetical protein
LSWLVLSLVPSSLMLGVTTYLSTTVAPVPLLWILPLALYLLSFILVFSGMTSWLHRYLVWALPVVLLVQATRMGSGTTGALILIPPHLVTFFVVAMVCHGELARRRPSTQYLTEYYLWISVGGVLGGLFNAVVAPLVLPGLVRHPPLSWLPTALAERLQLLFATVVEYPLMLVVAALLWPAPWSKAAWPVVRQLNRLAPFVLAVAVACLVPWQLPVGEHHEVICGERSFFGVLSVTKDKRGIAHTFLHGPVFHGAQFRHPQMRRVPMLYFSRSGPIGQVFEEFQGPKAKQRVAVVGLGIGSLACYAEPGQEFTFFEIDPAVERIARDDRYFTFLSDAEARGAKIRTELGDARLCLQPEADGSYGLLVLDAFSGDSPPTHLLTREAIQLYLRKLAPDGIIAFDISTSYLNLEPVLASLAQDAGLVALVQQDVHVSPKELAEGKMPSNWVIMARREEDLGKLAQDKTRWRPAEARPGSSVWTDSFSNILQVVRW